MEPAQFFQNSRARTLRIPREYASRFDLTKAIANNRAITSLDLSECPVRMLAAERACPGFFALKGQGKIINVALHIILSCVSFRERWK
jgi:hypothetical protein